MSKGDIGIGNSQNRRVYDEKIAVAPSSSGLQCDRDADRRLDLVEQARNSSQFPSTGSGRYIRP